MERFHQTHISSRFSFRIGEQIPDFWRCLDRQLLMLFRGRCFAGTLRRHHQNGPEVCAGRTPAAANDVTSFQALMLLLGTFVSSGCGYPKMTNRAFAFVSPPLVYLHVRTHRMRNKPSGWRLSSSSCVRRRTASAARTCDNFFCHCFIEL